MELISKEFGHILVYGDTNSGKTYYTKYLISTLNFKKTYIYAGVPDQWQKDFSNVYDNFDNIKEIVDVCKEKKSKVKRDNKFVIVFDDFNKRINTQTNQDYLNLFTEGRHAGIRVINLAHHVQDVGPSVRNNARFIVFTKMPDDELRRIAEIFYDKKYLEILRLLKDTPEYTVGILDKRNKELLTDIAVLDIHDEEVKPKEETYNKKDIEQIIRSIISESNNGALVMKKEPEITQLQIDRPEIAPLTANLIEGVEQFESGKRVSFNVSKNANRDFMDNSQTVYNTAIKNESKIDIVNTNHIINMTKITNEYEAQRLKDKEETRYLIRKPWKSDIELKRVIHCLNNELQPRIAFDMSNYEDGCIIFMHKFYGEDYTPPDKDAGIISKVGTMYESRNDPFSLFTLGLTFAKQKLSIKS
jgi:hypothetical protein